MSLTPGARVGVAGAAVVGASFGMARWAVGLTLPDVRRDLGASEALLGAIAGATFAGFLVGLLLAVPLARRRGPRAPTTVGGVCGAAGAGLVAVAPTPLVLAVGAVVAGSAAGWVWAPYSDIVPALAPPADRPRLLALITTGTSGGLVLVGLLAAGGPWRAVWLATGVAAAAAAVLNLRWVPRLLPTPVAPGPRVRLRRRAAVAPLGYVAVYFGACTAYFTYVADAAAGAGLGAAAGGVVFVVVGLTGLVGLRTGSLAAVLGAPRVAAACAGALGVSLALLGALAGSLAAVLASAAVFGVTYTVGAAVLVLWSAEVFPERPAAGFTVVLVVGSLVSIVVPPLVGGLRAAAGLPALLLAVAAVALLAGAVLAAQPSSGTSSSARR